MKWKHLGRTLLCLLLVCVLLVNISPIRAEASAGALLGSIAGVTSVNVPAGLVYGAAAIALGVMAGTNDDFVDMVDYAVDTATDWVKDGTVELLRVVDATGKAAYYAANDFLEDMRSWFYETQVVLPGIMTGTGTHHVALGNILVEINTDWYDVAGYFVGVSEGTIVDEDTYYDVYFASNQYSPYSGTPGFGVSGNVTVSSYYSGEFYLNDGNIGVSKRWVHGYKGPYHVIPSGAEGDAYITSLLTGISSPRTSYDLTLGHVSSVPIDGSSALDWSEEYASKRIYVTGGSNDPDPPDENNGKWFWPIALPLTAATLYAMSQADEWSGETPQEFDQYTQNTEFEILSRPEFDGYQAIEIAPVTNPNPNPNPDVGEDPDIGGDSDTDSDAEKTWFQRIVKGIEELPSKFESWITDCKTAIEELPSKFGSWLDKILEWLQKIWEGITSIPELLLSGIKALFIPSEDFLTSKVEAIRAEYAFADSIIATGEYIGASLTGLETSPPIIYIHLEDTEGPYDIGGTVPFIDMRWYERYKPTVDALLSALLWIIFCWRIFLKLPGIISGMPGDFVMDGLNHLGGADHLPSRKAGYEVQRMANREQIRRGNK